MRIEKDNIVIRSATIDDAIQLNEWWNDGRVMEHAGFPNGIGESLDDTIANIRSREGKLSQLCIIEIIGKPVGELSYSIRGDGAAYPGWKICDFNYQNQGYGPKIIMMLLEFIFTDEDINSKFPIEKIIWDTTLENERAQYVYENKIGARKIGIQENAWQDQLGNWRSAVDYQISKEDFFNGFVSSYQVKNRNICKSINEEIKSFKEFDYESFVNMFNSYFLDDFQIKLQYSKIEEICFDIIERVKKQVIFLDLIKVNNKSIGFIIYQIDSPKSDWCQKEGFGFIREIYIEKELRKQGLGKLLVAHAEQSLKDKNVEEVYLTSDNNAAFWNQCGYTLTHETGYRNEDPIYIKKVNQ
ncbi:GNAT family N-acetyltransferase [Tissierella sp. MB52-C2]|uniref:GNAT family N-acetyltransferase n=1 Tax=Tissierella sp. MB52-C2 TaxID=3070999 RepID=UPI00280A5AC9|nr:GNAT family N-acetyltransferase [Tissierella sp. MB52-C2]WMM26799.1 GNAT family N-acetyltransferase [Tissierella sp. MB52-C2]